MALNPRPDPSDPFTIVHRPAKIIAVEGRPVASQVTPNVSPVLETRSAWKRPLSTFEKVALMAVANSQDWLERRRRRFGHGVNSTQPPRGGRD